MSRVNVYSGPYQRRLHGWRDIVRERLAGLGYDDSYYDPTTGYDTFDPTTLAPVAGDGAPTLGPSTGGGFTPPSSGALIGPIVTNPNATLPFATGGNLAPAQQAQVGSTYVLPSAPSSSGLPAGVSSGISQAVASALGPSPVVAVPLTTSSAGMFLQNNMWPLLLIGGVALAAVALGGRRR